MNNKTFKKINTIFALLFGLGLLVFVILGIIFPKFNYVSDMPDFHGIALWKTQTGSRNFFHVSPFFSYQFSSIKLQLRAEQEFSEIPGYFPVFKGYVVQGFEKGEMVSTQEQLDQIIWAGNKSGFANGSLVSRDETVYFVSEGKARAVLSPEIFLQLGFQWDSVRSVDSEEFDLLEEGEDISFGSIHPEGTFYASENGLFVFADAQRRPISKQLLDSIPSSIMMVNLKNEELTQIGDCAIANKSEKKINCSLLPGNTSQINGNDYIFQVPQNIFISTEKGAVVFRTLRGMRSDVARSSLKRIKDTLALRYFPEITK